MYLTNTSSNEVALVDYVRSVFKGETILSICEKQQDIPQISVNYRNEPKQLAQMLAVLLTDLNEALGVKRGLTPRQLDDIVDFFPLRFPYLRINDVFLICQYIKTDNLEGFQIMDRLDTNTFFTAAKIYEARKGEVQAGYLEKLHSQAKAKHKDNALNIAPELKQTINEAFKEQKNKGLNLDALAIKINKEEK